jgi:dGTPase
MTDQVYRDARFYENSGAVGGEFRTPAQRDRDRILYSSALRRLAEITQVVSPDSGYVFHNRLTHTLQVAQVGRRLAERLNYLHEKEVQESSGLDPDVVEAACLAHDLGHPPFGHLAEHELNHKVDDAGGFEGNAQSFRIITRLAFRSQNYNGLDLSRATLGAVLKYPWLRNGNSENRKKWGAYESEKDHFDFGRERDLGAFQPSIEAQLMNVADDITYSVHDLEDFYRAGRIPLHLLASRDGQERARFFDDVFRRKADDASFIKNRSSLEEAFTEMVTVRFWLRESYSGTADHRAALRGFTGQLIDRYIRAIHLQVVGNRVEMRIDQDLEHEISMFKQLVWTYVIDAPSLATQQIGQAQIVKKLFDVFCDSALSTNPRLFPPFYRERLDGASSDPEKRRTCADFISGLTETQCINIFHRITGSMAGSSTEALTFL